MREQELKRRIAALRTAARALGEPRRTNRLDDADSLEMELEGMGLDRAAAIMSGINTPDLEDLDALIAAAEDATQAERKRNEMITGAIGKIRGFLGFL